MEVDFIECCHVIFSMENCRIDLGNTIYFRKGLIA